MVVSDIENTFGALEVGTTIAVFLFGIVTVQTYMYFSSYEEDAIGFKAMVGSVWLLELGHTIGATYEVYNKTILMYGKTEAWQQYAAFGAVTILGGIITMIVQSFFSYRLWKVLPNPWRHIGSICIVSAVARCVISFYVGIKGIVTPRMIDFERDYRGIIAGLLIMGASIDIVIATVMLYFLMNKREGRITRLIDRLIAYTIRTGLITSIGAIIVLILFRTMEHTLLYLAAYACLAKLYSNSLLSALNARAKSKESLIKSGSLSLPTRVKSERRITMDALRRNSVYDKPITIGMKTTKEERYEGPYFSLPYYNPSSVNTPASEIPLTSFPSPHDLQERRRWRQEESKIEIQSPSRAYIADFPLASPSLRLEKDGKSS